MALQGLTKFTITCFVKSGTLQNACSARPRVVFGLEKSAHTHTVKLMNSRLKVPKGTMTKVQIVMLKKNDLHESLRQSVVNRDKSHDRLVRPDIKRDTCHDLKQGPIGRRSSNVRHLEVVFSRHEAAEVYRMEEFRHAENNTTCEINESYCTSH